MLMQVLCVYRLCELFNIWLLTVQANSTALLLASKNGHEDVVRVFLAAEAVVNTQDKVSSITMIAHPSMKCVYSGKHLLSGQQVLMVTRSVLSY